MSFTTINRRILNEIDKETKNPVLRDLARALLQFEMENWGIDKERMHYKEFYEAQISSKTRRLEK